jgi:hypothetical protein
MADELAFAGGFSHVPDYKIQTDDTVHIESSEHARGVSSASLKRQVSILMLNNNMQKLYILISGLIVCASANFNAKNV